MIFEVGEQVMSPSGDIVKFDINESGAILVVAMTAPTPKEIAAFDKGIFEFREIMLNGIIFIIFKAEGIMWLDAPFHRDLAQGTLLTLPPQDGKGLGLHLMLVNADTGILLSQRMLGLSTNFTNQLYSDIRNQSPHDIDYDNKINTVYARYSSEQLAKMAKNYCKFR